MSTETKTKQKPKPKFSLPGTAPKIEKGIPMPFRKKRVSKKRNANKHRSKERANFSQYIRKLEAGDSFVIPHKCDASLAQIHVMTCANKQGVRLVSMRISESEIRFWRRAE